MKIHSTNYYDTFIEAAEDCPALQGEAPPDKSPKTVARAQYELLRDHPYRYTSDMLLHETVGLPKGQTFEEFFSKGQPCLRAGALGKRYGWGSHHDSQGRVALVGRGTPDYERLRQDPTLKHLKAMKNRK